MYILSNVVFLPLNMCTDPFSPTYLLAFLLTSTHVHVDYSVPSSMEQAAWGGTEAGNGIGAGFLGL